MIAGGGKKRGRMGRRRLGKGSCLFHCCVLIYISRSPVKGAGQPDLRVNPAISKAKGETKYHTCPVFQPAEKQCAPQTPAYSMAKSWVSLTQLPASSLDGVGGGWGAKLRSCYSLLPPWLPTAGTYLMGASQRSWQHQVGQVPA